VFEIFSVAIDGSATPVKISFDRPVYPDPYVYGPVPFQLDPDGSHIAYLALDGGVKLFTSRVDGSTPLVQAAGPGAGQNFLDAIAFASGGERVVYRAGFADFFGETWELLSVPADGSAVPVRIGEPSIFDFNGGTAFVGGDDDFAHYLAHSSGNTELFRTRVDGGGTPSTVNGPLLRAPFADVSAMAVSPAAGRVVYVADDRFNGTLDLYSVPRNGSELPVRLNTSFGVTDFALSPDGEHVVHVEAASGSLSRRLYSSRIDGSQPTLLSGPPKIISSFAITPDGTRVVFAMIDASGPFELFVVPLDGSASPLKLNQPLGQFQSGVQSFRISPDSSSAAFVADALSADVFALFGVPLDGSAAPVRLNLPLTSGGDVLADGYFVTPSNRVIFRSDQAVDERWELFSAPSAQSGSAVRLNPSSVPSGDVVAAFGGARVTFVCDSLIDERFELFSAPNDGSAAAIRLNADLITTGDVDPASVHVSPDGSRVVYRADALVEGVHELYCAPVDGSTAALRLGPGLDVAPETITIHPDGQSALFGAGGVLYVVPLDAGSAPLALAMPSGASLVDAPLVAPDGRSVVYRAELASARQQLLRAALDGGGFALAVEAPLPFGGSFPFVAFSSSGGTLAYVADQEEAGTFELFAALSPGHPHTRRR
jgi:Tol biopolymer transport system component